MRRVRSRRPRRTGCESCRTGNSPPTSRTDGWRDTIPRPHWRTRDSHTNGSHQRMRRTIKTTPRWRTCIAHPPASGRPASTTSTLLSTVWLSCPLSPSSLRPHPKGRESVNALPSWPFFLSDRTPHVLPRLVPDTRRLLCVQVPPCLSIPTRLRGGFATTSAAFPLRRIGG